MVVGPPKAKSGVQERESGGRSGGRASDSFLKKLSHTGVQRMEHVGQRYEKQVRLVQVSSQDRKLNQ